LWTRFDGPAVKYWEETFLLDRAEKVR